MKKMITLAGLVLLSSLAFADTKPSDASLNELLIVSDAQKLLDSSNAQMDEMLRNSVKQSLAGQQLTAEQQKIADDMHAKTMDLFKSEMSWEKLQPIFIQVYRDAFSQEEVDGMLAFYKSPAGKAVVKKMPIVMQSTMTSMQTMMQGLIPKLQKIQQDGMAKIREKAPK